MSASREDLVRFRDVDKAFGSQKILDNVSFSVPRGDAFCLLGRSGVGKSVTLKLLIGLLRPDGGEIMVDGNNVAELSRSDLSRVRKRIGFLFQHSALFDSISLGENVAFPLRRHSDLSPSEIREESRSKLEQVGLGDHYDKMPSELSGGMRKRAGLARALAMNPEVLLVDEPSAGLDPITANEVDELLVQLKERETTMVVVTHNIPSARRVGDELAILHEGTIVARGTPDELEASDNEMVHKFMSSRTGG